MQAQTIVPSSPYNPYGLDASITMNEIRHPHSDLVLVASHRGLHALVNGDYATTPGNSLEALGLAAQQGLEEVEIDVKLTSDNRVVMSHDVAWGRETNSGFNLDGKYFDPFDYPAGSSELYISSLGKTIADPQYEHNTVIASETLQTAQSYLLRTAVEPTVPRVLAESPQTLEQVLSYLSANKIQMVLAIDLRDAATAHAAYVILASTFDSLNRPYTSDTLFKVPALAFKDADDNIVNSTLISNTFRATGPGLTAHVQPVFNTGDIQPLKFGSEAGMEAALGVLKNNVYIDVPAVEIQYKQAGGNLSNFVTYVKSSNTLTIFSPYTDHLSTASVPGNFYTTYGYCCVMLSAFYDTGDTADDRGDINFVVQNGFKTATRDDAEEFRLALYGMNLRNISYITNNGQSSPPPQPGQPPLVGPGQGSPTPPPPQQPRSPTTAFPVPGMFADHGALLYPYSGDWFLSNIPFLEVPDQQIQQVYYYRWHLYKEHLVYVASINGWLSTEFLAPVTYGGPYGGISAAAGHQTIEGRWLRDQQYVRGNINYWLNGPGQSSKPQNDSVNPDTSDWAHEYSFWAASAVWQTFLATGDTSFSTNLLPQLVKQYRGWDNHFNSSLGLYWQIPVWDGTEYSPASYESSDPYHGGAGYRPTINSYQYGDANAISHLAGLANNGALQAEYAGRASALQGAIQTHLWDPNRQFFYHMNRDNNPSNTLLDTREEQGFIPWMFEAAIASNSTAFAQLKDTNGFLSAYGPTTTERRSRWFMKDAYTGCCHWDGPSWPFATSQTLTGLANLLLDYPAQSTVNSNDYVNMLHTYAATQYKSGVPYVAEAHDPDANNWIYDTPNHSEDYNHSSYLDNVIAGFIGLRGEAGNGLVISPLAPPSWDYFLLENTPYHGHSVTVLWDRLGTRYRQGTGMSVFVDNNPVLHQSTLSSVRINVGNTIVQPLPPPVVLGGSKGVYKIANVETSKLMGVQNEYPFDNAQIQQYEDNGSPDHFWGLEDAGGGYFKIRNLATNYILGVDQESTADSASIKQAQDNGTPDHLWAFVPSNGSFLIKNKNSGLLLGISGESSANSANVVQFHDNGTRDHLWTLSPAADPRNSIVYELINYNAYKDLAVQNQSLADGAQVQIYTRLKTPDQLWALEDQGSSGLTIIRNVLSNLVLGVDQESVADNALIKQAQDNGTKDHLWTLTNDNPFRMINSNSLRVLGVTGESVANSANVLQYADNGTPDHLWTYGPSPDPRSKPVYKIINVNSGKLLALQNQKTGDGTQIQQFADSGTTDHIWQLQDQGGGFFKISNLISNLVLGVDQESTANSALIKQAQDNGTPDHLWHFIDAGNGTYKIQNKNSGLLLGVDGESLSDSANIVQYQDSGTPDHLWMVQATGWPALFH